METIIEEPRIEQSTDDGLGFNHALDSLDWCSARIFELQTARKMLDENDPRYAQINETIDSLFAERARLLGVMNECNAASFGA